MRRNQLVGTAYDDACDTTRSFVVGRSRLTPAECFNARIAYGLFLADAAKIAPLYERLPDFVALLGRLDPRGAFRNAWLERNLLR